MKKFYLNALRHAKTGKQRFRVLLAASQAKSLSDRDYFDICEMAA